ncbi:PEPxxWA-CTERM sorting domain-containing protein [Sandaracinobacter sp. RS1-74]|uniref:PEPxxWA-CTERM sorting domain-containing protein n=1 Tax=Sandaracinobacteroides sayramensis TaxID=2913411 RepID=UPI001EDA94FE|nr:PEPxxWA-CTERM sorting domain-containing protein [Sandaracinobacteroides sayramensis]MCG2841149.1 PEPxxWA-CTERM sorting domain-containing protein [Sandaracinobacteroides sayramensis]
MRITISTLIGLSVLACAAPSIAAAPEPWDHCTYNGNGIASTPDPRSCASVNVVGHVHGNWGQFSGAGIAVGNNGSVIQNYATEGLANGYGSNSWDDGWSNSANAWSNSGSVAFASGDLGKGQLKAYGHNEDVGARSAFANARISDILTFNNTSGATAYLTFGYSFDGLYTAPLGYSDGYVTGLLGLALNNVYEVIDGTPTGYITWAGSGQYIGGTAQAYWDMNNGIFEQKYYYSGTPDDFQFTQNFDTGTGVVEGTFLTTIAIPVGYSQLGFAFTLYLDCRGRATTCGFGHTGALALGETPDGLTWSSKSGILFTTLEQPGGGVGGVPEPASWAMLLLGFGVVGAAARRQRALRMAA